jgi:hypothetical protein
MDPLRGRFVIQRVAEGGRVTSTDELKAAAS